LVCEYDSEHDADVDMYMEDAVEAPDGVNIDGHVDMETDGDNADAEDEQEKDEDD
jgi:hypothetical protein